MRFALSDSGAYEEVVRMKHASWILVLLALTLACGGAGLLARAGIGPVLQEELATPRIFAYRDWQSVGVQVTEGDSIHMRAWGKWLYTPNEYHGPEGHRTYPAPNTYPRPGLHVPGGVLLGRIGEEGQPFIVGRGRTIYADRSGQLYLRINDDILSDNEGFVNVEIDVTSPTPMP